MKKTFMKLTSVLFLAAMALISIDAQAGCNDPGACNFNAADTDALDCCFDNCINLAVGGGSFEYERGWQLFDGAGVLVDEGIAGVDASPTSRDYCLVDDCYDFIMTDTYGDGWNGGAYTFTSSGVLVRTGTLAGGFGPETASIGVGAAACVVAGCTDATACNFNALANQDDGSCEFLSCAGCTDAAFCEFDPTATLDDGSCATTLGCMNPLSCLFDPLAMCGDQVALCAENPLDLCVNAQDLGDLTGSGTFAINVDNTQACVDEDASEASGVWYTITTPAGPSTITIGTADDGTGSFDTQLQVWEVCPDGVAVAVATNDDSNGTLFSELFFDCDVLTASTQYRIMVEGFAGQSGTTDLIITTDEVICITGCTNPLAVNFEPGTVIDDNSCIVPDCGIGAPLNQTYCYDSGEVGTEFLYESNDPGVETVVLSFNAGEVEGDQFDQLTIYDGIDATGAVLYSNAGTGTVTTDLTGVTVQSTGDYIYMTLTTDTSFDCATGGQFIAWDYDVYCASPAVAGCTDPLACNFDPAAGLDDNSCCTTNCIQLQVGGDFFDSEITWNLVEWATGTTVASGAAPADLTLCLNDGCHVFEMFDSYGDGWGTATYTFTEIVSGTVLGTGALDTAENGDGLSAGSDFLDINGVGNCPIFGCDDPTACNFDPSVTDNDGSCCNDNCVNINMGGGLNDADLFWFLEQSDGTNVFGAGIAQGAPFNELTCLIDDCYTLRILSGFGQGWPAGVIDITDFDGNPIYTSDFASGEGDGGYLSLHFFSVGGVLCTSCQDMNACNFDASGVYADCDACEYDSCAGCTYSFAENFDPAATYDDGSCTEAVGCIGDANNDNVVNILDLAAVSSNFGAPC